MKNESLYGVVVVVMWWSRASRVSHVANKKGANFAMTRAKSEDENADGHFCSTANLVHIYRRKWRANCFGLD